MAAALTFNPRHQVGQRDRAPRQASVVELAMVRRTAERRTARIAENRPAFGAGARDGRNLRSWHVVILSVGLCVRIQYGSAPVNDVQLGVAIELVDKLQRLMSGSEVMRGAVSNEELHTQILAQIRDNMALQGKMLSDQSRMLNEMHGRLIRVEERDERIERLEKSAEKSDAKLDALLRDKDQRDGANNVFVGIRGWTPVIIAIIAAIASIFSAIYLAGRATGVVSEPATRLERAEAIRQGVTH